MKDIITDSLRYWEPRRLAYNAILGLAVAGSIFYHQPPSAVLGWQIVVDLLFAAVLANVLYCAAYAADLLVQFSDYQTMWRRCRWLLWLAGTILAVGIFLFRE